MFKAKFSDASIFKNCVDAINAIIDEGVFVINENGISLKAMDAARIAMVSLSISPDILEEFDTEGENDVGLDFKRLSTVVKRGRNNEALDLSFDSGSFLKLTFIGRYKRSFNIPILDIKRESLPVPTPNFTSLVEVDSFVVKDALKDAEIVSDNIVLIVDDDGFKMEAKSDTGRVSSVLEKNNELLSRIEMKDRAKSMFSLEYLKNMITPATGNVTIELGVDMPIKLSYSISGAEVIFFLAPRIEQD